MKQFDNGVITHIVTHLPENQISLHDVAEKIPISRREADKLVDSKKISCFSLSS